MTLEDFYFISQIAAAVGIMASLIFVGLQVRQSTRQAKADAVQAVHDNLSAWYMSAADTPFKAEAGFKGLHGLGDLSGPQSIHVVTDLMALTSYLQSAFFKWRDGDLPDDLWHGWEKSLLSYLDSKGGKEFWELRKYNFTPDFTQYVEDHLLNRKLPEDSRYWDRDVRDANKENPESTA
ncbi:MAG: hypothetical protein Pars92KO_03820 [Parasphingorhabdus sp.]